MESGATHLKFVCQAYRITHLITIMSGQQECGTGDFTPDECHSKLQAKSYNNTSGRHDKNRFVNYTKFSTRFTCYGKSRAHIKFYLRTFRCHIATSSELY